MNQVVPVKCPIGVEKKFMTAASGKFVEPIIRMLSRRIQPEPNILLSYFSLSVLYTLAQR